jgi:hypothetical protein
MGFGGIIQGVLSNIIWWAILGAGVIAVAWLRHKRPQIAPVIAYGLGTAVSIAVLFYAVTGRSLLSVPQSHITSKNIESKVVEWTRAAGLQVSKQNDPNWDFQYVITKNGHPIGIGVSADREGYLQLQCPLTIAPEHLSILSKLSPEQANEVAQEVILDLSLAKIGFMIQGQPMRQILLQKAVPINDNLTKDTFLSDLDDIDSDFLVARAAAILSIEKHRHP